VTKTTELATVVYSSDDIQEAKWIASSSPKGSTAQFAALQGLDFLRTSPPCQWCQDERGNAQSPGSNHNGWSFLLSIPDE
jgi:hypothetical protein